MPWPNLSFNSAESSKTRLISGGDMSSRVIKCRMESANNYRRESSYMILQDIDQDFTPLLQLRVTENHRWQQAHDGLLSAID